MWLWASWSKGPKAETTGQGYFNCPHCASRQPCDLIQTFNRTYLYGLVPVSQGKRVGGETYRCLVGKGRFVPDGQIGYDFGAHAVPRTWSCFECNGQVPYERFECHHCGYRFDVHGSSD